MSQSMPKTWVCWRSLSLDRRKIWRGETMRHKTGSGFLSSNTQGYTGFLSHWHALVWINSVLLLVFVGTTFATLSLAINAKSNVMTMAETTKFNETVFENKINTVWQSQKRRTCQSIPCHLDNKVRCVPALKDELQCQVPEFRHPLAKRITS